MVHQKLSFRERTWSCRLMLVTLTGVLARFTACTVSPDYISGGWDVSTLPSAKNLGRKDPQPSRSIESEPSTSQP